MDSCVALLKCSVQLMLTVHTELKFDVTLTKIDLQSVNSDIVEQVVTVGLITTIVIIYYI